MKKQYVTLALFFSFLVTQISAETLDSGFNQPMDLTDEQATESQNFIHQGQKDRKIKEGCEQKGLGKCLPSDADPKGFMAVVEQNIGKAYAMVFGGMSFLTGGGGPKIAMKAKPDAPGGTSTPPAGEAPAATGEQAKGEEKDDYCMYGAMGWEMLAGLMQSQMQGQAQKENNIADPQLKSLVHLKEAHKARQKTATYQSTIYGAVTACYVIYGTMGGAAMTDWKYLAKLGGSTALTALYLKKAQNHKKAAGKVQSVIDELPKAGDCNPWTGTACFCNEPTSKTLYPSQYQEVCVLNDGDFNTPKVAMGCGAMVDGKMKFDKECKCKQSNSCFNTQVKAFNPKFNLGQNFMDQANKGFNLLGSGQYDEAKLTNYSTQSTAMALRIKDKLKPNAPKIKLTDAQKKDAEAFKEYMPDGIAAIAAVAPQGNPPNGGLMASSTNSALDKLPDSIKKVSDAQIKGNYKTSGGGESATIPSDDFQLPPMPGLAMAEKTPGTEVVSFAEKAFSNADVSNAPDTPIFDIISNRYRRSGWTKLQPAEVTE